MKTGTREHELAQRIVALTISELGNFIIVRESPNWAATLERLERKVQRILEE